MTAWESFYVIVGSSAGALIGLQFVVLTLIAERPPLRMAEAGAAFSTPSVVHFGIVLLLSAIVSAPWTGISIVAVIWGLVGLFGIVYAVIVARRLQKQSVYRPVFEDWLFHVLLPLASYATLAVSAFVAWSHARRALFAVAASVCWHSQRLGRSHLPHLRQQARSDGNWAESRRSVKNLETLLVPLS
jgi:hypothetical protein